MVKRRYVDLKYQSAAWIFQQAYSFFTRTASEIVPRPGGAESGIWLFKDRQWACCSEDGYMIRAEIPADQAVCFDMRVWNRILNLEYIESDPEDAERFRRELDKLGLQHTIPLFETPYYPLQRQRVQKSWERLYQTADCPETYMQAAVWELRPEWVCSISHC